MKILGISGSLRRMSYNTSLLKEAQSLMPASSSLDVVALHGIPLYDGDLEQQEGTPEAVKVLKQKILDSDALLLSTPEYNNGIPGVFKNAIDWLSRPTEGMPNVLAQRPVALMGASPGGFGTILSQAHWLPVLRTLNMPLWVGGRLMVSKAHAVFDEQGKLQDMALREQLEAFLQGYLAHLAK